MITELKTANELTAGQRFGASNSTVLLVEDDVSVRNLVARLLKMHGYRVVSAASGRAALPLWDQHKDEIDLLLTDVVMPDGVSGRELARRCQSDNPHLQVIYTSGYNVELSTENGWLREGIHFVQKPYRPEQLLQLIAEVLGKASHSQKITLC